MDFAQTSNKNENQSATVDVRGAIRTFTVALPAHWRRGFTNAVLAFSLIAPISIATSATFGLLVPFIGAALGFVVGVTRPRLRGLIAVITYFLVTIAYSASGQISGAVGEWISQAFSAHLLELGIVISTFVTHSLQFAIQGGGAGFGLGFAWTMFDVAQSLWMPRLQAIHHRRNWRFFTVLLAAGLVTVVIGSWVGTDVNEILGLTLPIRIAESLIFAVIWIALYLTSHDAGVLAAQYLRFGARAFAGTLPYLAVMSAPLIGFAAAYLGIIVFCASWYMIGYRSDPTAFDHLTPTESASFNDFLYLSVMTISTLGYSDVRPVSGAMKLIVSFEAIAGNAWFAVGLAGMLAFLSREFGKIALLDSGEPSASLADVHKGPGGGGEISEAR